MGARGGKVTKALKAPKAPKDTHTGFEHLDGETRAQVTR